MNNVVICTGFHRSGTSLAAHILQDAGLPLGDSLHSSNISNPDGHFEDIELVQLNDMLLTNAGTNWMYHEEVQLPPSSETAPSLQAYSNSRTASSSADWCAKDPRSSLFLPAWKEVLKDSGKFVILYRYWPSCIQSLYKRHSRELAYELPKEKELDKNAIFWKQPDLAARMWLSYNKELISFAKSNPAHTVVIPYEELINGFDIIDEMNFRFKMKLPISSKQIARGGFLPTTIYDATRFKLSNSLVDELESTHEELQRISAAAHSAFRKVKYIHFSKTIAENAYTLCNFILQNKNEAILPQKYIDQLSEAEIVKLLKELSPFSNARSPSTIASLIERLSATNISPSIPFSWKGRLHLSQEEYSKAEECFIKALETTDSPDQLQTLLGDVYLSNNQFKKAETHYKAAIESNPENAFLYFNLSSFYCSQHKEKEALELVTKAHCLKPDDPLFQMKLLLVMKHTTDNKTLIEKAQKLWSKYHVRNVGILLSQQMMKENPEKSTEFYQSVMARSLKDRDVEKWLLTLDASWPKENLEQMLQWILYHWKPVLQHQFFRHNYKTEKR